MLYLRQSTASQAVVIGPFVDSTDGNTAETALTVDAADIRLSKNGANIVGKNSGGGTHDELGYYTITLDATDTDTVGRLQVMVHESGALPVYHEFQVLEEATFDQLFAASALGYIANAPVNVAQFGGSNGTFSSGRPEVNVTNVAGTSIATLTGPYPALGIAESGTMQAGSTGTTAVLRASTSFVDDNPIGWQIWIYGGTGVGQTRFITDWVSATDTATVATWTTTPDNTSTYIVFPSAPAAAGSSPTAGEIADAVWDEDATAHQTQGTFGQAIGDPGADTDTIFALVNTNLNATVSSRASQTSLDTVDDFLDTEIASIVTAVGTTIPNALTTIDDFLDTEVAAIKAKTDQLTFTVANVLDVNTLRINGVTVIGAGTSGDKWRA
jgi:hypothetical protein